MAASTALSTFNPNFTCNYSVVIDRPISQVFAMIGTAEGHQRTTTLSGLCSDFALLQSDTVSIPRSTSLAESNVRTLPSSSPATEDAEQVRHLPRQFFRLQETVPMLFGLIKSRVNLSGTLTWDEAAKVALYETHSDKGITVRKVRVFEEVEGKEGIAGTKVSEKIEGRCPSWMQWIVQKEATEGHIAHMNLYHTLF